MAEVFSGIVIESPADVFSKRLAGVQPTADAVISAIMRNYPNPCVSCVVEEHYVDIDYSASYFLQQGRSFTPSDRMTTRVHFFSTPITSEELQSPIPEVVRRLQANYLGYTVIRPGSRKTLGRTFLAVPTASGSIPARFPTRTDQTANLCGIPLRVSACPFMAQDGRVMACATAAIWMASHCAVGKVVGIRETTAPEITASALSLTRPFGPSLGERGLSVAEMEKAFVALGYDPSLWFFPTDAGVRQASFIQADGGIPCVFVLEIPEGLHAVTVVGYAESAQSQAQPLEPLVLVNNYRDHMIIHDDQGGMYLRADISSVSDPAALGGGYKARVEIHRPGGSVIGNVLAIIAPSPQRVLMTLKAATTMAFECGETYLRNWFKIADPLVVRPFVVRSNSFKEMAMKLGQSGVWPSALVQAYRALHMPRYIWVVEYSYARDWPGLAASLPLVFSELLLDATSSESVTSSPSFGALLAVHVPGLFVGREAVGNRTMIGAPIPDDKGRPPYPDTPRP